MPLLHGPDADDDPAADPEHPGELSQRPHAALRRGDVVDHGDRQRRVHATVPERQRQVITVENLQYRKLTSWKCLFLPSLNIISYHTAQGPYNHIHQQHSLRGPFLWRSERGPCTCQSRC